MDEKEAKKIYNSIKNERSIKEICEELEISELELRGIIEALNLYGKRIQIIDDEEEPYILKKAIRKSQKTIKPDISECIHTKLLVVSDTHLGNVKQQLHLLNELYLEGYKREISTVLHIGDLSEGDYSSIRKESPRQVFLHGFDEICGYLVDMYPKVSGMTTEFILGSHDETLYKNGQATIGCWLPKCRPDMKYLGQDQKTIQINNIKITLDHPGDGSAYALSYKPQKRIEELETGNKPKILLIGHYHKAYYFVYRNVHCIEVPSLCEKTQFQTKKGIYNSMGGYFLDIYSDEKGNIQYINVEPRLYNHEEAWDEAGKDKKRVRQLVI